CACQNFSRGRGGGGPRGGGGEPAASVSVFRPSFGRRRRGVGSFYRGRVGVPDFRIARGTIFFTAKIGTGIILCAPFFIFRISADSAAAKRFCCRNCARWNATRGCRA